jgi:hypothetical protein
VPFCWRNSALNKGLDYKFLQQWYGASLNQAKAHIADFRNGFADGFMHLARQKNEKKQFSRFAQEQKTQRYDKTNNIE